MCVCVCVCELLSFRVNPPKVMAVEQDELLWDFKLQSDRTVDKQQKTVVTDVATPGDSSIREKEYKKLRNTRSIKKKKKKEKT